MIENELLSQAIDAVEHPFVVLNALREPVQSAADFQLFFMNTAAASWFGRPGERDKWQGGTLVAAVPDLAAPESFQAFYKLLSDRSSISQRLAAPLSHDPAITHIHFCSIPFRNGYVMQWHDASAEAEALQSWEKSDERYRLLNETMEQRIAARSADSHARSQQLRALALALADAEARERKRLAQLLHDNFQQLISAAKLKAGMLRRSTTDPAVQGSAQHLERLLEEAIAASRSLTLELSPPVLYDAGLNAAVEVLVRNLEQQKGLRFNLDLDPHAEPAAEQVRVLLFEAIRELLQNVVQHAAATLIEIRSQQIDGFCQISVNDNGKGFTAEPAIVAHDRGGIRQFGLLEIRERLGFLGGELIVDSLPGEGSRLTLRVPTQFREAAVESSDEYQPHQQTKRISISQGNPVRVVVADDHAIFRDGMISLLGQDPVFKVVGEAADGEQTLRLVREVQPDLLLLDISMPKMSGIQVASMLSKEMPQTVIVGLSMHERQDMADAMKAAGASAYVTKGGNSESLLTLLRGLVA